MKRLLLVTFYFLSCIIWLNAQTSILDGLIIPYRIFRNFIIKERIRSRSISTERDDGKSLNFQDVIKGPFPCNTTNTRSDEKPASVHKLKPGDIDLIGGIGDSLTAGFALTGSNLYNYLTEDRGMVFSVGGEKTWREFTTLPNILKVFNPKLFGYSLRSSLTVDRASQFNVAENGAVSYNIPYMTKVLIKRILRDRRVNVKEDWKMITIFIGGNDFCSEICYYKNETEIFLKHRIDLLTSLRLLRSYLPRTIVNIVTPPDVGLLGEIKKLPNNCYVTQRLSCPCFIGEMFKPVRHRMNEVITKFRLIDFEVADYNEFDLDDFAVVVQPFLLDRVLPMIGGDVDLSYFAIDCFHFSQKTHALFSRALWNNLLEPVGNKTKTFLTEQFLCPSENSPYIYTKRNSK